MCIRDRESGSSSVLANDTDGDVTDSLTADLITGPSNASASVSYTHLRAHETVLDLVCRLLLEKKKKHSQHAGRSITPQTPAKSKS